MKTAYYSIHVYKDELTASWLNNELTAVSKLLNNTKDMKVVNHGNEWEFVITYCVNDANQKALSERSSKYEQYYKLKQELGL